MGSSEWEKETYEWMGGCCRAVEVVGIGGIKCQWLDGRVRNAMTRAGESYDRSRLISFSIGGVLVGDFLSVECSTTQG